MGIQKFIVNGDEAKIDYEGLENKPFGNITEETIYPLKASTYETAGENAQAMLNVSDFTKIIVADEHYIVRFDGTIYEVDAVTVGSSVVLCNAPVVNPGDFPSEAVFLVYSNVQSGSLLAAGVLAHTAGEHSLSISKVDLSTLDPKYLPKDLQFVRENSKLIMDTTSLLFEED